MISRSLRICLLGDFSYPKDEGMKKVAHKLAVILSRNHEVLPLSVKNVFFPNFWSMLRRFGPKIILYVGGPSFLSFALAKAACIHCAWSVGKRPKVVVFALHPFLPFILDRISSLIQPDLVLALSFDSQQRFRTLDMPTEFLPIGVDAEEFMPSAPRQKRHLRKKYRLRENEFVVLHVGPVRRNRGLEVLTKVQMKKGNSVLVIGSTSMSMDRSVYMRLTGSGCLVWRRHFAEIEELYQLADLYVFPVVDRLGSVELPLSVMEAMACNLPVISTRFGALPRLLIEGEGLIFVNEIEEIPSRIEEIKNGNLTVETRRKILNYSWEKMVQALVQRFHQLVEEET